MSSGPTLAKVKQQGIRSAGRPFQPLLTLRFHVSKLALQVRSLDLAMPTSLGCALLPVGGVVGLKSAESFHEALREPTEALCTHGVNGIGSEGPLESEQVSLTSLEE